jgi:capsular polysaccharide biosynthesis protein
LEPISYLRAPIRRWPVVVAAALVALIVAVLIPVGSGSAYPPNTWRANAVMGLAPQYRANGLGAKLGIKQLEFYAHVPAVIAAAAAKQGVPLTNSLKNDIVVGKVKVKGASASVLEVAVLQHSRSSAVGMTNAFVTTLSAYSQTALAAQNKNQITEQEAYIANLEKSIASLPLKTKTATPTTTPTTRPPTIIKKKVIIKKPAKSLAAPSSKASLASFSSGEVTTLASPSSGSPQFVLVDTSTTTTTSSNPTTLATLPPATGAGTATGSTTPTTESLNKMATQEENRVLASTLGTAVARLGKLQADGIALSGIRVITPAHQKDAILVSTSSVWSNVWLRALVGLVIGVLLGVVIAWLLDAFDRRIRTSKRAEEVFGLPVVVEVPALPTTSLSVIPVVDVVVDPYSPASEAYRRLHVAILTAPTVTWVKRGSGLGDDSFELPRRQPQDVLVGAPTQGPDGGGGGDPSTTTTGQTGLPAPRTTGGGMAAARRKRFAILVTSAADEPTRSLVVVNLAAVFAEAGDRVLVATTGGMRTRFDGNGHVPATWDSAYADMNASDLVANARPSQIPGVSSLALGQLFPNPSRLALNAPGLVEAARDVVDVLLLEAPLLSTQDGTALLPAADLVVVVCEAWQTTVANGVRSQRLLSQFRPPVLGLVMTNMQAEHPAFSAHSSLT